MSFLFGVHHKQKYLYLYIFSIILGATTTLDMMINLIDGVFALMAIPTMTATVILAPKVIEISKHYFQKLNKEFKHE